MTDAQWEEIRLVFPPPPKRPYFKARRRGGRPRLPDRVCFDAMLYLIFYRHWYRLPKTLGSPKTVRARLERWDRGPLLIRAWRAYIGTIELPAARELAAALCVHTEALTWQGRLRFYLLKEHPYLLNAAPPRKLPPPGTPRISAAAAAFLAQFRTPPEEKPSSETSPDAEQGCSPPDAEAGPPTNPGAAR